MSRLQAELGILRVVWPAIQLKAEIPALYQQAWPLFPGWNKPTTRLLVLIPAGYPATPPDNFLADPDLALASGGTPGNTSPGPVVFGEDWLQFSYHVDTADWTPHADPRQGHNLVTFLHGVNDRLRDPT
ncbi:MAG: E2/UBC family protein [Dehalococcoidia bacterium]